MLETELADKSFSSSERAHVAFAWAFARPRNETPHNSFPREAAAMAPFPKIFGPPRRLHE